MLERAADVSGVKAKGDQFNVVTDVDVAAEAAIVSILEAEFPTHSIVSEELGIVRRDPAHCWIIDPLDGTSNYVAGIPWYGVLLAHPASDGQPDVAVMHLPASGETYVAERGKGVTKNGMSIAVSAASSLREVLWACGMDDPGEGADGREKMAVLRAMLASVRNVRSTNCLLCTGRRHVGLVRHLNAQLTLIPENRCLDDVVDEASLRRNAQALDVGSAPASRTPRSPACGAGRSIPSAPLRRAASGGKRAARV